MNFKKLINWLSIIGSITSLIGFVYIFYPIKDGPIKLNFIVSACDNLTIFNNVGEPEIKAQFEYKGKKIYKLWRVNVLLKNASNKTIIGDGQLKNIMFDKLEFYLKNGYKIIDKKMIKSDFNHQLTLLGNDTIQLSFGQWRTDEKLEYSLYITTERNEMPNVAIFNQTKDRQIIDGDIVFLRETQVKEQVLLTDRLGKPAKRVAYILFFIILLFSYIIIIVIIISNPISLLKRKRWKKKYLQIYNDHVLKQYANNKPYANSLVNKPELFNNWASYKGEKYPKEWGFDFEIDKLFGLVMVTLLFIILLFAQIIITTDLIQQFP